MKKCPKCKAEIQENARFCLYCMTSFDEKQAVDADKNTDKRWLFIAAALLALLLIGAVIAFSLNCGGPSEKPSAHIGGSSMLEGSDDMSSTGGSGSQADSSSDSTSSAPSDGSSENETPSSNKESSSDKSSSSGSSKPSSSKNESSSPSSDASSSGKPSSSSTPSSPSNPSSGGSSSNGSSGSSSGNSSSGGSSTIQTPTNTSAVYLYRDAAPVDDYMSSPSITDNAVVIIGVREASSNGIYEIPSTIGGKKVVAVMNEAFCSEDIKNTVNQVIIPESVKTINYSAFGKCYNLTDLYIKGEAVGCPSTFLPDVDKRNHSITVHASATCHNRNFYTYKTLCSYWNVTFKEWNG